jgi:hypothetical protein
LRPPTIGGDKPAKTRFKPHSIGYFHINPAEGKRTIPVAIDRKLTLAHLRLKKMAGEVEPAQVLGGGRPPRLPDRAPPHEGEASSGKWSGRVDEPHDQWSHRQVL